MMNNSKLIIYGDNAIEASWFRDLHPIFQDCEYRTIKGRGQNPNVVDELIQYDRPDIILTKKNEAILVIEKTREVPTGHNVGQRVARLVKALEYQVPVIKFFPFDAKKHGAYAGICNLNIRILEAFDRMWDIHDCPIVALNWISDDDGELIDDGSEDDEIRSVILDFVNSNFSSKCSRFNDLRRENNIEYDNRLAVRYQYGIPPPSVKFKRTNSFLNDLEFLIPVDEKYQLQKNEESVVYLMEMTEEKCKRQDPYTGTQFIYDYAYCRIGIKPEEKSKNLILYFPKIRKKIWQEKNPNDLNTKSCNWYLIANALVFCDGIEFLR
jgi:hypothetical protein